MIIRTPDYYKDFKCIAGACTDTCCAGWQVDVDERSYEYYKGITGEFGERLHSVMVDGKKGAEGQFRIREDGRCPFLNDDNLCDLYAALGEDALCVTCDQYPRYSCEFGNLRETGIALSCKTAAELILRDDKTSEFVTYEDEDASFSLNEIDGELYLGLCEARNRAYEIIWNKDFSIETRLRGLLVFAGELQKNIKKPANLRRAIKEFKLPSDSIKCSGKWEDYDKIWHYYLKQVIIKREWPALYEKITTNIYNDSFDEWRTRFFSEYERLYEFENLATYFVYRYFLKAVFDKDVLGKVKMCIVSIIMIWQCDIGVFAANKGSLSKEEQIEIVHLYSREVEHSEENFDNLVKLFNSKRIFRTDKLLLLI